MSRQFKLDENLPSDGGLVHGRRIRCRNSAGEALGGQLTAE